MRNVTLEMIFDHPIARKYLSRSGIAHAVSATYHAYKYSLKNDVNPDLATKAALLHDVGHYTWYTNGEWNFDLYKQNDIHAIKGAERAHKLLITLGEDPVKAKEIALAILLHTDSYLPEQDISRTPLQKVVKLADEADEEPSGSHHYRHMDIPTAKEHLKRLDQLVEKTLNSEGIEAIV